MKYEVTNLKTDESHGVYDTLDEARGCVLYDRLGNYRIDSIDSDGVHRLRVKCDPPYTDDQRVLQGTGHAVGELPS